MRSGNLYSIQENTGNKVKGISPISKFFLAVMMLSSSIYATGQTSTFNYTGGVQSYTVPAGITSVIVDAVGGVGGTNNNWPQNTFAARGGNGGRVQCILSVTAGSVLQVYVGGAGANGGTAGGFNGGGNGSTNGGFTGGGGGGASDIRVTPYALGNRLVVAGGGGGAGLDNGQNKETGGAGGNTTGQNGFFNGVNTGGQGGFGGTPIGGGNPGSGGAGFGSQGVGGNAPGLTASGGGGGGYYGGGGGGTSWAGGGGGSSYTDAVLATNVIHTQGASINGNGIVIITAVPTGYTATLFGYTGASQTYTPAAGVTSIIVDAQGGIGGANDQWPVGTYPSQGGSSGRVQCTLAVTPGVTCQVNVGGRGGDGAIPTATPIAGAGGYNGGGNGSATSPYASGGGGGATDIRVSPFGLGNRLVVAGGGGGAGLENSGANLERGGPGGGTTGGTGFYSGSQSTAGGQGGGTAGGGAGGVSGGVTGTQGNGAGAPGSSAAGGGGGGNYGGGSGSTSWSGGGGGSSYTDPVLGTGVTHTQGFGAIGNGTLIVMAAPPSPSCTYAGSSPQNLTVCQNSISNPINSLLTTNDPTSGLTLTWTVTAGAFHGSVTTGGTQLSTGGSVTPAGFSYTPNATYTGSDAFVVQVSDGTNSSSMTVNVTVNPTPPAITGNTTICIGGTTTLANTSGGGVWSTSAPLVATVGSGSGVVTGINYGNATISYTLSGSCAATVNVAVSPIPTIASVSPTTAIPGSSVTLTGTNFNATSSNDIVYFGSVKGTVTAASSNSLTVTVPNSSVYYPVISVENNTCALMGWATYPFLATFNNAAFVANTTNFDAAVTYATGTFPNQMTYGDIDGDGKTDIVVSNYTSGTMLVYRNTSSPGAISFAAPVTVLTVSASVLGRPSVGDIDGDGKLDIVYMTATGPAVMGVLRNTSTVGSISFAAPVTIGYSTNADCSAIADLDGDGKPDVIGNYLGNMSVFRNTSSVGSISFAARVDYTAAGIVLGIVAGNIAGNGKADIALASNNGLTSLSIFRNTSTLGTISFAARQDFTTVSGAGGGSTSIRLADLDGDGVLDVALSASGNLSVFPNTSSGGIISLGARVDIPTAGNPGSMSIGDLNGDGKPDIVASSANPVFTFINNSSGPGNFAFTTPVRFSTGIQSSGIVVADLDGDGLADIAITEQNLNRMSLLRNDPLHPITGTLTACPASTTTLSDATPGGKWVSGTPATATVNAVTGVVTGVATGTVTISYVGTASTVSANNIATVIVTINPNPAVITGTTGICSGTTTLLSDATGTGSWSSSNTVIATVGSGTGLVNGASAGVATISYIIPSGCYATAPVTVNQSPTPISGSFLICVGGTSVLTDGFAGGVWTSGTPGVASIGSSTGIVTGGPGTGNSNIVYTMPGNCAASQQVTVNSNPAGITGLGTVCIGSFVTLNDATLGGLWSSSAPAVATVGPGTGTVVGITTGMFNISYTLTATGCFAIFPMTVNPNPAAITGNAAVCMGLTTVLADATPGGAWSSSAGGTASVVGGTVTGVAAGNATISYSLPTTCYSIRNVTVNPNPVAIGGAGVVCVGLTTVLTDATGAGAWSSGNPAQATIGSGTGVVTGVSGLSNPVITYTLPTTCLITKTITVNPLPVAITGTFNACPGTTTTLSDASGGGTWTSNNTAVATVVPATGVVTGVSAGVTTITYTITASGCIITQNVTINPNPAAITGNTPICVNSAVSFADGTAGGTWSSSNSGIAAVVPATGLVAGVSAGNPVISYSLGTGCIAIATATVNPVPAGLTFSPGLGVISLVAGTGSNAANGDGGAATAAAIGWPLGVTTDPSGNIYISDNLNNRVRKISTSGIITTFAGTGATGSGGDGGPATAATFSSDLWNVISDATGNIYIADASGGKIRKVNTSGIISTFAGGGALTTDGIPATNEQLQYPSGLAIDASGNIYIADANANRIRKVTPDGTITTVAGIGGAGGFTGDGAVATAARLNNPYGVAVDGAGNVYVDDYQNARIRKVGTNGIINTICGNGTFTFSGDGGAATAARIGDVYTISADNNGNVYIPEYDFQRLRKINSAGIINTIAGTGVNGYSGDGGLATAAKVFSPIGVTTDAAGNLLEIEYDGSRLRKIYPTSVCLGSTITLSDATGGGAWSSANTAVATVAVGVVSGISAGNTAISYSLATGCASAVSTLVNSVPAAITGVPNVCVGATSTLADGTTGGVWSSSNTAVGSVGSLTGIVTGVAPGNINISYTLPTGCVNVMAFTVNAQPPANTGVAKVCTGSTTLLSNALGGGAWTSSNIALATVAGGTVTGVAAGNPIITYTTTGSCIATTVMTVNPTPSANTGANSVCVGSTTTLANSTGGGTWSSTNPAFGSVVPATGVVTGVAAGTGFNIVYTLPTTCNVATAFTVNPTPTAITGAAFTVCTGQSISLSSTPAGGTWSSSNPAFATVAGTVTVTGVAAGIPTISYTLAAGSCRATTPVTVNQAPSAIVGSNNLCIGVPTTETDAFGGGVWASQSPLLATIGSSSGIALGSNTGSLNLSYTLPGGCFVILPVTVSTQPAAITGTFNVCVGATTALSDPTGPGTWSSSNIARDSVIPATGVVTGVSSAGIPNITFTLTAGGCTAVQPVTVNPSPAAIGGSPIVCVGSATTLTETTVGGTWTSSTGSATVGSTTGVVTGVSAGNPVIKYTLPAGCAASVIATVNPQPTLFTVTGGGGYCAGGAGMPIGLSGSAAGINYQLWRGTTPVGAPLTGVGPALNFGTFTTAGTYTIIGTNTTTGCSVTMTGSATITINPLPATFAVTGGGGYCAGGAGLHVFLANSVVGVNYQLMNPGPVGAPLPGTGVGLDFGLQTVGGTYTVVATNTATSCSATMPGSVVITVNPLPNPYAVTGGGAYCAGGIGVNVGLASSDPGNSYQLFSGAFPVGSPLPGGGGVLTFGLQTTAGIYTVVSTVVATGCQGLMTGSVTVTINPLPTAFAVTGGGGYCTGGTGVVVGLSSSTSGVSYQLKVGGVNTGVAQIGTGGAISFGLQTAAGTYTVLATSGICTNTMSGSVTVTINPLPTVANVTGGGAYCAGGTGVHIGLNGSTIGVSYQLKNGAVLVGGAIAGTGTLLDFGLITTAATYTVTATNPTTTCTSNMAGSAVVSINPLPISTFTVGGGGGYCSGGTGVNVTLSSSTLTTVTYQLFNGVSPVGAAITGTGGLLTFPLQTVAGTYTIVGAITATGCNAPMTGSVVVSVNPLPTAFTVTGGGSYCAGGTGVIVGVANSTTGVNYQLQLNGINTGGVIAGSTGAAITFPLQTGAGTYTVVANNPATTCSNNMTGSVAVSINPLPTVYSVTGGGGYCAGGTGVHVGLGNSNIGISYQLYLTGTGAVGGPLAGTNSPLDFGLITPVGTYTVSATNTVTGCVSNMTGNAVVSAIALPALATVSGGGPICAGGAGLVISVGPVTTVGVNYQLYNGATAVGAALPGDGGVLNFPAQTAAGTYTVAATNGSGCTNTMTGSAVISVSSLPNTYTVTGGGGYCNGGLGVHIGLSSSDVGVNYQLFNPGPVLPIVAGTGLAIDFGLKLIPGTYTAVATNSVTGCTKNMTGAATVSINPLPALFIVGGGGSYCAGTPSPWNVTLGGSALGVNYQLMLNGTTPVGSLMPGTTGTLDFGIQTTPGVYTVVATDAVTACTRNMVGSVTITVNPLPAAYNVTGGGSFCPGGSGVAVGLNNSDATAQYQLYVGGVPVVGGLLSGTSLALNFGAQTLLGNYTVVATSLANGCTNNMTGSATVANYPVPNVHMVTGGGSYCAGGTGIAVALNGSDAGITYQLSTGGSGVGIPIPGTGSAISFGPQTAAGSYTVVATNAVTSCTSAMLDSAVINVNPLPAIQTMTGGGVYCVGGAGVDVALGGSEVGVSYQLYNGASPVGAPIVGTTLALDFGIYTAPGNYTVVATNTTTLCGSTMAGGDTISLNPPPTVYSVTGGGNYCAGGSGVHVRLSNSQVGINYQLYVGSTLAGAPWPGTGSSIDFGLQTTAGIYTVKATNPATGCNGNMTGSATVATNALPTAYTATGGGGYCPGGAGLPVGLGGSGIGIRYQLYNGFGTVGTPVSGTGSSLNFGTFTATGNYFVIASNPVTGCTNTMTDTVAVVLNPLPTVYNVTGSGSSYCIGGAGVTVYLSMTQVGVSYELYRGTAPVGTAVAGTGAAIDFGPQTLAGTYTVVANNTTTSCGSNMSGSVSVTINTLPLTYTVIGGGSYCPGGAGVHVGLNNTNTGIKYQLFIGGATAVGAPVNGTGFAIDFGLKTAAGTYTVVATNAATGCTNNMVGSADVALNPLPVTYTATGGGSYCAGGTGVNVGLSGSVSGTNYQLYFGPTPIGAPMSGTGIGLNFGLQTAPGVYTITAADATSGCSENMAGTATVSVNSLPTVYFMAGGGNYCPGGSGVPVTLSGSDMGINYQLYYGSTPSGSPVAGTGGVLNFGTFTGAGTYTVVAKNAATGCTKNMSGSAAVGIYSLPSVYSVVGGGSYCAGTGGIHVGLSGSSIGILYQLYENGVASGTPFTGTGAPVDFGAKTDSGLYTVVAMNSTTTCSSNMTGSASISVNPVVVPVVSVTTASDTACDGNSSTFTAVATGTGLSPLYQWTVNGAIAAAGNIYTYVPANGDVVQVTVLSSATCAMPASVSSSVTMTVLPKLMPSLALVAVPGVIVCQGTAVNFVVTPTNGGSAPSYLWLKNGLHVGASSTLTDIPANGDVFYCEMTSNYACPLTSSVSSSHVTMEVDVPVTPIVALTADVGTNIYNGQTVTITAHLTNTVPYPIYKWYVNGVFDGGFTSATYTSNTLSDLDIVTCEVTSGGGCPGLTGSASLSMHVMNVGVKQVTASGMDVTLVPNPNKGIFTVKGSLGTTIDEDVTIEITDMLGQVIYRNKVQVRNGNINEKIELGSTVANGMYLLSMHTDTESKVFHIVVEQ